MNTKRLLSQLADNFFLTVLATFTLFFIFNIFFNLSPTSTRFKKEVSVCQDCNIILISLDALRAESLPCFGYKRNTAPNLCGFAQKNILFKNAYSQANFTLDSHMSIMTSLYPSSHNVRVIYKDILSKDIKTLAEALQEKGYDTTYVGITDDPTLPLTKGFEQGFNRLIENTEGFKNFSQTMEILSKNSEEKKPTFVFFHTYEVHAPYLLPDDYTDLIFAKNFTSNLPLTKEKYYELTPEFLDFSIKTIEEKLEQSKTKEEIERNTLLLSKFKNVHNPSEARKIIEELYGTDLWSLFYFWYFKNIDVNNPKEVEHLKALYDENIYLLDKNLKNFLDQLAEKKLLDKTIVIITSDHGEEFAEHGRFDHVYNLYETETHIPLIMAIPGIKNFTSDTLVQGIDVYPTILGLLGISGPETLQGINLAPFIFGVANAKTNPWVVSEHHNGKIKTIRDGDWRLYTNGPNFEASELYNVPNDPSEQNNLIKKEEEKAKELGGKLKELFDNLPSYQQTGDFPDWIDEKTRQSLREKGYF